MSSGKLNSAITAIKSGDKSTGLRLLTEIVQAEPSNENAWLWLTTCLDDVEKKKVCLKHALSINPSNQVVVNALSRLENPPQPTLEELAPNPVVDITPPIEKAILAGNNSAIKPLSENRSHSSVEISPHISTAQKAPSNKIKKYIPVLGGILIIIFIGLSILVYIKFGPDMTTEANKGGGPSTFNESDALLMVQNWKAPENKGMTCKEVFDNIVDVYKNDLGISDATVIWLSSKQSDSIYIVSANMKGETGWANFDWQVKFPDQKIISLGELNVCKSSDRTPFLLDISTPEFPQSQTEPISVPNETNNICFPPSIPGISFTTAKTHLSKLGIKCNEMTQDSRGYYGSCEGISIDGNANIAVDIYSGNKPDEIYLILSSVTQLAENPSDEIAVNILGTIAKIPYTNANPEQAQLWVMENLSSYNPNSLVKEQPIDYFGGVRYHMSCASKYFRCLAIGQGSGSDWNYDCGNKEISAPTDENEMVFTTNTPILTQTPTLSPVPIIKTGTGNSIVSINKWNGPALIHVKGSPPTTYGSFTIKNDDGLFLAIGYGEYDGVKTLDFFPATNTKSFEIKAGGDWALEIYPLQDEFMKKRILTASGIYQGNNDDVLFIEEGTYQIKVKGNSASTNFVIWSHGEYGDAYLMEQDLLVNITEPYEGIIDLPEWVRILEIEAVGPWSIEISNR